MGGIERIEAFIREKGYEFDVRESDLDGAFRTLVTKDSQKIWHRGVKLGDVVVFWFGDWRDKEKSFRFVSKDAGTLDERESRAVNKYTREVEKERSVKQLQAQEQVEELWNRWREEAPKGAVSDYLEQKNLRACPGVLARLGQNDAQKILVIPMRDVDGTLWNFQQVYRSGKKVFHARAKVKGLFHKIAGDQTVVLLGEGYATCLAAWQATGFETYCAFNVGNLEPVLRAMIAGGLNPAKVILLADWDGETYARTGKNPGMLAAQKLSLKYKVRVAVPSDVLGTNVDFADLQQAQTLDILVGQTLAPEDMKARVFKKTSSQDKSRIPDTAKLRQIDDKASEALNTDMGGNDPKPQPTPALKVARVGTPWAAPVYNLDTRTTGFHHVIPKGKTGVTHEPCYTDLRLAFDERHHVVTHTESETIYAWDGTCYRFVPELEIHGFAEDSFDPKPKNAVVAEFFGSVKRFRRKGDAFFATTKKVNFKNGWLDIDSMSFQPHTPDVGFKNVLAYDFDETATCAEWDAFLERVTCGDQELAKMVMEYLGYILSGDECWAQVAMVFKGEGSNGKSTLLKVVRALIGRENLSSAKVSEFKSEYTRQRLDGKLANIAEETPKDAMLESSLFKDIVSGGIIQVRAIYGTPYDLEVKAKLLFSCNDMPPTGDSSPALMRRLLIVPFNAVFTEENADPFMDKKLMRELPGIFNRALLAYQDLVRRGRFHVARASSEALEEYKRSNSPVLTWLEESVRVHALDSEPGKVLSSVSQLYAHFREFAERHGFSVPNYNTFCKNLRRALPNGDARLVWGGRSKDGRYRAYRGVTDLNGGALLDARARA